jgi:putative oxidoreductase
VRRGGYLMTRSSQVASVGHAMLGSMFVAGGVSTFRHAGPRVNIAADFLDPLVRRMPFDTSAEQIIRFDAAAKVVGGLALMTGCATRAAASGLALSLVPTTLSAHCFWTLEDPLTRAAQRAQFFKNLSMLGGLLVVAAEPRRADVSLSDGHGSHFGRRIARLASNCATVDQPG